MFFRFLSQCLPTSAMVHRPHAHMYAQSTIHKINQSRRMRSSKQTFYLCFGSNHWSLHSWFPGFQLFNLYIIHRFGAFWTHIHRHTRIYIYNYNIMCRFQALSLSPSLSAQVFLVCPNLGYPHIRWLFIILWTRPFRPIHHFHPFPNNHPPVIKHSHGKSLKHGGFSWKTPYKCRISQQAMFDYHGVCPHITIIS